MMRNLFDIRRTYIARIGTTRMRAFDEACNGRPCTCVADNGAASAETVVHLDVDRLATNGPPPKGRSDHT
jgi:hypothetical protein